ncbi:MAG TPA: transporter [Sulfurospirillum sp. UBA12182]|nr:MAG TPA: transporter [Sulfurospirillum sp. UBA12182]
MLELATALGFKIFPLYITISLGYILVRFFQAKREAMASLLIYILGPIVVFMAAYKVELNFAVIFLPFVLFILGSILSLGTLKIGGMFFKDNSKNILAFSAGTGNTGYFGIPLAIMLLDESLVNIYIFTVLASLLYENTVGFFVVAKGHYSIKQSLIKVSKLPALYALLLGLTCNVLKMPMSEDLTNYLDTFKNAYAILGMMMIGMGLSGLKNIGFDKAFITFAFVLKFIVFPFLVLIIIWLDSHYFGLFPTGLHQVMFLFAIPPMAGNTVAVASLLNVHPQKASLAVVLSTALSLFTIPLMVALFMP